MMKILYQNQKYIIIKKTQILKYIYFLGYEVNPHVFRLINIIALLLLNM